jgi:polar amino acid transport system permease protein
MSYTFDFYSLAPYWRDFAGGAWLTTKLSFFTTVTGFIFGTLCAIGLNSKSGWLSKACNFYVETIRNTPLLVQIFLVYFGLSSVGLQVPAMAAAVAALAINLTAYTSEIMRAGIESIHKGQLEAAECLGLSKSQIYWHVVLRPAVERVYPSLTSQFILLMLASSITSQISVDELTGIANRLQADTYLSFETYLVVAVFYLLLSLLMRVGFWVFGMAVFTRRRKLGTPL